ncbi:MAG: protein kinase [Ardenticatenaceae bacterium]|nr:protein kinase [Ardenticatenaceae bacterium]
MDLTGRYLGKYELLERVGRGGMAYVYKAYQPTVDRPVAVKVLHSHLADDSEFLERFKREARGLGRLRHAHIVNVIDFDVDDSWYYMVMDFIEGGTLQALIDQRGRLPLEQALRITAQLADALDYAHRRGRIHRDVKPGNVMFADSNHHHAVVTDFGLTRLLNHTTMTVTGTVAGTPAYMSPEAAQGQKVDGRSDIYSLGVMLYEMLTGRRPYLGETPLSLFFKMVSEPLPPARSIKPDLPPWVDDILERTMAKLPEDRYQTAGELYQEVTEKLKRLPFDREARTITGGRWQVESKILQATESGQVEEGRSSDPADEDGTALMIFDPLEIWTSKEKAPSTLIRALGLDEQQAEDREEVPSAAVQPISGKSKLSTWFAGGAFLLILVAIGLWWTFGLPGREGDPGEIQARVTEIAEIEPAGVLRFAASDANGLRQYTLAVNNVLPPPVGQGYALWFDVAGQIEPINVATLVSQNGRITYADVLVESMAAAVTGVRISLEADDSAGLTTVVYLGTVDLQTGLAEIEIFAVENSPENNSG